MFLLIIILILMLLLIDKHQTGEIFIHSQPFVLHLCLFLHIQKCNLFKLCAKQPRKAFYRLATDGCQAQVENFNPCVASQSNSPTPQLELLKSDLTYLSPPACRMVQLRGPKRSCTNPAYDFGFNGVAYVNPPQKSPLYACLLHDSPVFENNPSYTVNTCSCLLFCRERISSEFVLPKLVVINCSAIVRVGVQ